MTRGKNEEREFLKRVDAMLAGQEIVAGEDVADDLRGTVEFARKLVDLHEGPTPEFSQRLKSRLLIKLTEQDEAVRAQAEAAPWERSWFSRLLWGSPVWRTAAVSLVLVVAVVTVLWRTGMFTGTAGLDTPALETVADQTAERAMAPLAADDMAVEETADGAVAVAEAPVAEPTAEAAAAPAEMAPLEMALADDGAMTVVVGDVAVELLPWPVSADGSSINIAVEVTAGSAVSADEVVAWYRFDDGPQISATDSTSRYLIDEDATRVSWASLGPMPSDATKLTFTIDSIGEWEGPWAFEIPLPD